MEDNPQSQVAAFIDSDKKIAFQMKCIRNDVKMAEKIREWIDEYINQQ